MITIPISVIAFVFGVTLAGAGLGFMFTVFLMFGCDTKYIYQNMIIGVVTAWAVVGCRILTDAGILVWK
jgi:hypothetical protein